MNVVEINLQKNREEGIENFSRGSKAHLKKYLFRDA